MRLDDRSGVYTSSTGEARPSGEVLGYRTGGMNMELFSKSNALSVYDASGVLRRGVGVR